MDGRLTREEVAQAVKDCVAALPRDECRTCECFLGFLTQLEIDAAEDVSAIVSAHQVPRADMHGCLGCDPCPPGTAFAEYLKSCRGVPRR